MKQFVPRSVEATQKNLSVVLEAIKLAKANGETSVISPSGDTHIRTVLHQLGYTTSRQEVTVSGEPRKYRTIISWPKGHKEPKGPWLSQGAQQVAARITPAQHNEQKMITDVMDEIFQREKLKLAESLMDAEDIDELALARAKAIGFIRNATLQALKK